MLSQLLVGLRVNLRQASKEVLVKSSVHRVIVCLAKIHLLLTRSVHTVKLRKKAGGLYFSKALFEGLIFGGAYIRRGLSTEGNLRFKIDLASLIFGRKFTVFALFYFVFEGNFQVQSPEGLIFGRAI